MADFLGDGIFNVDGEIWKYQRQVSSHEFNTKSLRKFVENVVDAELNERLIPVLAAARFAFDNICKIAFGYDPAYLLPSLPHAKFAVAFEEAVRLSSERFNAVFPFLWKIKRNFNIGTEKKFKAAVGCAGQKDEDFVTDIVISFILAGRDTTSAALTWFFWLISGHPQVEDQILKEIKAKSESPVYDEVKDMIYTHASLCESMRFYPPVPIDTKAATEDDILPDGTFVKKGTRVGQGICLGKEMAFLQMKRVVAGILRRFRVVPVAEKVWKPVFVSYPHCENERWFPKSIEERKNIDF
ncbi:hypothetical protein HAX54_041033 [Datura stramonium]|uniref:Cytochrome P450 n=1 Tax=Datura stramonium TaxID=4076 RepID=A0ABS8SKN6_DATST|nr:hypothetical protein [Datura stramonium]